MRVELSSEFRYRTLPLGKDTLVIVISQSGETADSLAALRVAKERLQRFSTKISNAKDIFFIGRGLDVDKPRNLAKSVTVE